jgi:threonine synthase
MKGIADEDCVWGGGNLLPVEVKGSIEDCFLLMRSLFSNRGCVEKYGLTVANTANIGRLLPQAFFYMYAFSRLKGTVLGDIYYALEAENYGDIVSGLYSWRFSLPVHGFITNCTSSLTSDVYNRAEILESFIPLVDRESADPATPSNLERLEDIFIAQPAIMKDLIFPVRVDGADTESACKELFMRYGEFVEPGAACAYAASKLFSSSAGDEGGATVLVVRDHPALFADQIRQWCGEEPEIPAKFAEDKRLCTPKISILPQVSALVAILQEITQKK